MERWDAQVKQEHATLESQVAALVAALWTASPSEIRQDDVASFVIRTLGPQLELHLRKEEQAFFPILKRFGPIARDVELLKQQHEKLRVTLRRLSDLCAPDCLCGQRRSSLNQVNWKEVVASSQQFVALLEEHEQKEEQLFTEVLEPSLQPHELMQLARGFEQVAWKILEEEL